MLCKKHRLDIKNGKLLRGDDRALGEGPMGLWKAKELRKAHWKSIASPLIFLILCSKPKQIRKKVCVQKQTLNHFVNPTLDFTFLQWGSHSFIQIPKVEIICSKCFQSRPAERPNDFSRAGENWNFLHSNGAFNVKKNRETNEGKGQRNVLIIYLFILLQLWLFDKVWGDTLIAKFYFLWQGSISSVSCSRLWWRNRPYNYIFLARWWASWFQKD